MILIALIILPISLFYVLFFTKSFRWKRVIVPILSLCLILCVGIISANDAHHFGASNRTTTTKVSLNQQQPLMYVKLGSSDKSRVYLISKGQHTDPEHGTVTLQHTTQQRPTVIIKKETMTYRTGWQKFWFGWSRNDRQLRHVYYTFKLPRGYALKQVKR